MKILALIPARGGSKRLPRKNILPLGGMPLINWSIDVVKNIPEICDILVSTDDEKIADIAFKSGALVPWLRPAELSTDTASSIDVALHALDWYEEKFGSVDGLLLLQPTSPFRTKNTIKQAIKLFRKFNSRGVLGVSTSHSHPSWAFRIEGNELIPFVESRMDICQQSKSYNVNGCIYLKSPQKLRSEKTFLGEKNIPLVINSEVESIDIDTEYHWKFAEYLLEKSRGDKILQDEDNR